MAEFIVGNPLRKLARNHETLRQLLWRLDYALVWLLQKLLHLLPVDLSSRAGDRIGAFIGAKMPRKTAIFRENMRIAFPELTATELDDLVRRAWGRAGRVLAEYAHLDTIYADPNRIEINIRERIGAFDDPDQPAIFVSAHQSNWEINAVAAATIGLQSATLYSPPTNPLLDRLLRESRRVLQCELIPRDNSVRLLVQALKKGRSIGVVMDRRVDDGVPIRFFGQEKLTTLIPAKLALKFNCALVPVQVERLQDARFRVTFHAPIHPSDPNADETTQAINMTQQIHGEFESWIRKNPQDWFCSKRMWPKSKLLKTEEVGGNADIESHAN